MFVVKRKKTNLPSPDKKLDVIVLGELVDIINKREKRYLIAGVLRKHITAYGKDCKGIILH